MKDPKIKEALNLLAGKVKCKDCDNLMFDYGSWRCKEHRQSGIRKPAFSSYRQCSFFKSLTEYNKKSNISRMETVKRRSEKRIQDVLKVMRDYL